MDIGEAVYTASKSLSGSKWALLMVCSHFCWPVRCDREEGRTHKCKEIIVTKINPRAADGQLHDQARAQVISIDRNNPNLANVPVDSFQIVADGIGWKE